MPIDVIRRTPRERKPSFSEQIGLNEFLGRAGGGLGTGVAESIGGEPMELQKIKLAEALKGKRASQLEQQKQMFKEMQNQKKMEFLQNLLQGGESPEQMNEEMMGQEGQMQSQGMRQGGFNAANLSDEAIIAAEAIDPNLSKALAHAKDVALREDTEQRKLRYKTLEAGNNRALKTLDKVDAMGQEIPLLESAVFAMEDAIVNGDQSFWSLDNLAEMTGMELFRTAKGGQFKTAAKTYFINDLKASGARPNQFLERQLADALAKVGRSQEANETVIESFKFSNDLKKKYHETARDLEKFYDEHNNGLLPSSFSRKIEEQMKPYVDLRQKQYESRLHQLSKQEKEKSKKGQGTPKLSGKFVDVLGPDGQTYEVDQSEVEFLPEGYMIQ